MRLCGYAGVVGLRYSVLSEVMCEVFEESGWTLGLERAAVVWMMECLIISTYRCYWSNEYF